MKTFHDFLIEQDAPKPGIPNNVAQQPQGQQPQGQQPQGQQPQGQQPQGQQPVQPQQKLQKPSNKDVFDFYTNIYDVLDNGSKVIANFVNTHPKKNEWYEGANLANLWLKIRQDIYKSENLLRPLMEAK